MCSVVSRVGHDASPHTVPGQWKRAPGRKPIMICSSRLPSALSRNSTPDTLHGPDNRKAAVNNEVVSIPPTPERPYRQSVFTHTKQRKAIKKF